MIKTQVSEYNYLFSCIFTYLILMLLSLCWNLFLFICLDMFRYIFYSQVLRILLKTKQKLLKQLEDTTALNEALLTVASCYSFKCLKEGSLHLAFEHDTTTNKNTMGHYVVKKATYKILLFSECKHHRGFFSKF